MHRYPSFYTDLGYVRFRLAPSAAQRSQTGTDKSNLALNVDGLERKMTGSWGTSPAVSLVPFMNDIEVEKYELRTH